MEKHETHSQTVPFPSLMPDPYLVGHVGLPLKRDPGPSATAHSGRPKQCLCFTTAVQLTADEGAPPTGSRLQWDGGNLVGTRPRVGFPSNSSSCGVYCCCATVSLVGVQRCPGLSAFCWARPDKSGPHSSTPPTQKNAPYQWRKTKVDTCDLVLGCHQLGPHSCHAPNEAIRAVVVLEGFAAAGATKKTRAPFHSALCYAML